MINTSFARRGIAVASHSLAAQSATAVLREGGMARLERVDAATGEIKPISNSAISRALKQQQLSLATQVVKMILKIDDVISMGQYQ